MTADRIEIRWETHDCGGSAWISQDGEWLCVWSTAPGNIGQTLPSVDDTDELLSAPLVASISMPPDVHWLAHPRGVGDHRARLASL